MDKNDLYALRYSAGPEKLGEARPVRRHPMLDHPYGRAARPTWEILAWRASAFLNVALVAFIVVAYFLKRLH
jgi:hypothetical protein